MADTLSLNEIQEGEIEVLAGKIIIIYISISFEEVD